MMFFDPKWVRASKEGMWQEGGEGREIMNATVKQRKTGLVLCTSATFTLIKPL
jgi:hypothetical protein